MDLAALRQKWESAGQGQVFRFFDTLDAAGKQRLAGQLEALDPKHLAELAETYVKQKPPVSIPNDIRPVKAFPREPGPDQRKLYEEARVRGEQLLARRQGRGIPRRRRPGNAIGLRWPERRIPGHSPQAQAFVSGVCRATKGVRPRLRQAGSLVHHDQRCQRCADAGVLQAT